jgi:hypothetical protein
MGLPQCPGGTGGSAENSAQDDDCRSNIPMLFAERWASVMEEYATRYGDSVKGWWVDGCYSYFNYTDRKLQPYHTAVKRGNPQAMVAFNPGANYFPIGGCPVCAGLDSPMTDCYSAWDDFTNGEADWCVLPHHITAP